MRCGSSVTCKEAQSRTPLYQYSLEAFFDHFSGHFVLRGNTRVNTELFELTRFMKQESLDLTLGH